jgi:hypothetical protein
MTAAMGARLPLYLLVNIAFAMLLGAAVASHGLESPRLIYLVILGLLCSSPMLLMRRLNDRFAILAVNLLLYFLFFAAADVVATFAGAAKATHASVFTLAEGIILAGAASLIVGYVLASKAAGTTATANAPAEWSSAAVVLVGALLWVAGTAAVYYWQIHIVVRRSVEIDNRLGEWGTMVLMLGRMLQPLGIMILAYAWARYRRTPLLLLLLGVVTLQVLIGFVADSKETAMRAGLIVIIVLIMVRGRVPWAWLAGAALFVMVAFPIFQAYRAEVVGARGYTNQKAAQHLGKVLEIALSARDRVMQGTGGEQFRAQTFVERIALKNSIDIVAEHVGHDVALQRGATLLPLVAAFIPRIIWPDKPDAAAGQVFNREFGISVYRDVYISPSHLGELYWNFGWAGVLIGMAVIGGLLGWINARCDMSTQPTLTRLLVVSVTIYSLCVRFEGSIAVEYIVWMRSMAAVALLHLLFARRRRRVAEKASSARFERHAVAPRA